MVKYLNLCNVYRVTLFIGYGYGYIDTNKTDAE